MLKTMGVLHILMDGDVEGHGVLCISVGGDVEDHGCPLHLDGDVGGVFFSPSAWVCTLQYLLGPQDS